MTANRHAGRTRRHLRDMPERTGCSQRHCCSAAVVSTPSCGCGRRVRARAFGDFIARALARASSSGAARRGSASAPLRGRLGLRAGVGPLARRAAHGFQSASSATRPRRTARPHPSRNAWPAPLARPEPPLVAGALEWTRSRVTAAVKPLPPSSARMLTVQLRRSVHQLNQRSRKRVACGAAERPSVAPRAPPQQRSRMARRASRPLPSRATTTALHVQPAPGPGPR